MQHQKVDLDEWALQDVFHPRNLMRGRQDFDDPKMAIELPCFDVVRIQRDCLTTATVLARSVVDCALDDLGMHLKISQVELHDVLDCDQTLVTEAVKFCDYLVRPLVSSETSNTGRSPEFLDENRIFLVFRTLNIARVKRVSCIPGSCSKVLAESKPRPSSPTRKETSR